MATFKGHLKKSLIGVLVLTALVMLSQAGAQQKKPEVPYVPTPEEVVEEMLMIARVGENDVLYDLGCGDGRIVITAAKKFGCRGVGIDIDPQRIKESRENAIKEGVSDRVQFYQMDLFEADINAATVVTLYLLSKVNLRLRPKLFKELNPDTRVVSHAFNMGNWEPDASSSVRTSDYWSEYIVDYWDEY
ncbi:MAG: class I SAM-dependent methyltransferase, partial [Candidatus Aminicenantes bacterium]|nr:class I SAM-dependent methyltransferase [Candidatus Aminicenantes bacterium]